MKRVSLAGMNKLKSDSEIIDIPDLIQLESPRSPKVSSEIIVGKDNTYSVRRFFHTILMKNYARYTRETDC